MSMNSNPPSSSSSSSSRLSSLLFYRLTHLWSFLSHCVFFWSVVYQDFFLFISLLVWIENEKTTTGASVLNSIVNEDMIDEVLHIDDDPNERQIYSINDAKRKNYRFRNRWNDFTECTIDMRLMNASTFCRKRIDNMFGHCYFSCFANQCSKIGTTRWNFQEISDRFQFEDVTYV